MKQKEIGNKDLEAKYAEIQAELNDCKNSRLIWKANSEMLLDERNSKFSKIKEVFEEVLDRYCDPYTKIMYREKAGVSKVKK